LEQPKKPGARDISDLKARLGLKQPAAPAAGMPAPAVRAPFPGAPAGHGVPHPSAVPAPAHVPAPIPAPVGVPAPMGMPSPAQPPAPVHDPYVAMRPPPGKQFDLRPVDDGVPTANVRSRGVVFGLILGVIGLGVGGMLGVGFGIGMSGRRAYNQTNLAAKRVKAEFEEMHKTANQIATAVALSAQRLGGKDRLAFDSKLIDDLEKVKLDPRPDTSKIFRVDYYRLEDIAVDNLMSYYYDTIALYTEVEKHIKKSKSDRQSLEAFAAKQGEKAQANYGVVFAGGGKMVLGNLVEVGERVCKGGAAECELADLEGFQIRAASGATWVPRKVGPKPEGGIVVPIDRTPLLEAALAGSPDQARQEQYKLRMATIQLLLLRINATHKQLKEALDKATARPDLFSL
jgi:hypothetical protein